MRAKVIVTVKHDTGKAKFSVWAESLQDATEQVMKAENCPPSAIQSVKVVKPTIYDIKRLTGTNAPHFFTRKTMQFFQQKLSDFKVYRQGNDKFLIRAKRPFGYTERIFNPFTNELEFLPENN